MGHRFECLEFELSPHARADFTDHHCRELIGELCRLASDVYLLEAEIHSGDDVGISFERVKSTDISEKVFARVVQSARKGFRTAFALDAWAATTELLANGGYQHQTSADPQSFQLIQGWLDWIERNRLQAGAVVVFSHDYDPAFVFKRFA